MSFSIPEFPERIFLVPNVLKLYSKLYHKYICLKGTSLFGKLGPGFHQKSQKDPTPKMLRIIALGISKDKIEFWLKTGLVHNKNK